MFNPLFLDVAIWPFVLIFGFGFIIIAIVLFFLIRFAFRQIKKIKAEEEEIDV